MLTTGIKGCLKATVTNEKTAKALGSGELNVFGTPAMIALIEETAWRSVSEHLEDGMGTVGTNLNIAHLAPTPVGMEVTCETTLTQIDRRKLVCDVIVKDEKGEIGRGNHERFIVDNAKFQAKANEKK